MLAAGALGTVQLASMALYGDLAHPPALPPLLGPQVGVAIGARLAPPAAPAPVRAAYAQALLHRGDTARAAALIVTLPPDAQSADLRGQLAQTRGDEAGALRAFVDAGDFERAQALIDARLGAGDVARAAGFERALVGELTGPGRAGVRARAFWRLGQITQAQAVLARDDATLERAALAAYDEALALAPNDETYLLAAGQQALTLGDRRRAAQYYTRALDAVPNSADARAGLARAQTTAPS